MAARERQYPQLLFSGTSGPTWRRIGDFDLGQIVPNRFDAPSAFARRVGRRPGHLGEEMNVLATAERALLTLTHRMKVPFEVVTSPGTHGNRSDTVSRHEIGHIATLLGRNVQDDSAEPPRAS